MSKELTRKSFTAVAPFQRIEHDLRRRLGAGEWALGTMLPSRRELARQYQVEPKTLQRAMASLLEERLLQADGTRGTFVLALPKPASTHAPSAPVPLKVGVLLVGQYMHAWSQLVLRSIERQVSRSGGSSAFQHVMGASDGVAKLLEAGCTAIISEGIHGNLPVDEVLAAAGRTPVVFIANEEFKRPVTSVHYDSFDAGYQAGEYLLGKGVRELLYVAGGEYNWIRQRELGIAAALRAAGLPEDALRTATSLLGHDDGRYEEAGYLAASAAFARRVPQAVVACNDRTAMGVARAASEFGLEVGRAIGLVGFDDEPESSALGLTTFQPPLEEMGAEAARLAINAVARTGTSQRICLHSHLIERHSTARVGAAVKEAIAAVV